MSLPAARAASRRGPPSDQFVFPLLVTIPTQLVSCDMSVMRGCDPDFPRNLSKMLTVD